MKEKKLAGLEPQKVFGYFEEFSQIPHGSWNTKAISDYLVAFAREHGLRYIQDETNNVIIFKNGTPGYEDHEPMILQGHMDMVCQKDKDCPLDMEKDPLDLAHDGTYVFAKGTTLGADDGIAMAMFLAVLDDDTIAHPPLEVVFTSDEEIGLIGANAIDLSMLKGKKMLNIDTFREGTFTAGSAGGAYVTMEMPLEKTAYTGKRLQITLENLRGGHSAVVVQYNYANAAKTMGTLLQRLQAAGDYRLIELSSGTAGNAVPRSCQTVLAADDLDMGKVNAVCQEILQELKQVNGEQDAKITVQELPAETAEALTQVTTENVVGLINDLPNGVQAWETAFEGLPQTSTNLGIVELTDKLSLLLYPRSSLNQKRQALQDRLKNIAESRNAVYGQYGVFSAWEYREDSPLRELMSQIYQDMYGVVPTVRVVHAGLECGAFGDKIPGLDCISTGPNAMDVHTSREKMEIASMQRSWDYLLALLKAL